MKSTAANAILERLANEQRRVLSGWRGLIFVRRATFELPPGSRRWTQLPPDVNDLASLFRQMRKRGEIDPIRGFRHLYEVTVPYARLGFIDEREILFELNPYAVLSHFTAFVFHGVTTEQPKGLTATFAPDIRGEVLPLGTLPQDWEGVVLPGGRSPERILGRPVRWVRVKPERFFGVAEYRPLGYPIRITTLERTLIDGLQQPELCGGIPNVLRAWILARGIVDLDLLVSQVDRFDTAVLRQRVGFVIEQLGMGHPRLDHWRANATQGGSSRLLGSAPFSPQFDERWKLSINAPIDVLQERTVW